jgi:hypothetical protein
MAVLCTADEIIIKTLSSETKHILSGKITSFWDMLANNQEIGHQSLTQFRRKVAFYQTALRRIPNDNSVHIYYRKTLKLRSEA